MLNQKDSEEPLATLPSAIRAEQDVKHLASFPESLSKACMCHANGYHLYLLQKVVYLCATATCYAYPDENVGSTLSSGPDKESGSTQQVNDNQKKKKGDPQTWT